MAMMFVSAMVFFTGVALAAGADAVTYEKDIKKIISAQCQACHGSGRSSHGRIQKKRKKSSRRR